MESTEVFNREVAVQYICNSLGVGSTEEINKALAGEQLALLNRIIRAYQHHLAFQNITLLSRDALEVRVPTPHDILKSGLTLQGGLCFNLNVFMHYLLQAVGYDTYLISGTYSSSSSENSHVALVVKGLNSTGISKSLHLVDVGCGHPTFEAVPLHQLPKSYFQAGLEYRIDFLDGQYVRLHRKGDSYGDGEKPIMIGEWRKVFHFDPDPRRYEFFPTFMKSVFVDKENNTFFQAIRVVRFPMTGDASLLAVRGNQLLTTNSKGERHSEPVDDVAVTLRKYFPNIPSDQITKAVAFMNANSTLN